MPNFSPKYFPEITLTRLPSRFTVSVDDPDRFVVEWKVDGRDHALGVMRTHGGLAAVHSHNDPAQGRGHTHGERAVLPTTVGKHNLANCTVKFRVQEA